MTSDGTNSFAWDCENRMIKITYPGSGNNSQFSYDCFGRNVEILEYSSGSLTSTKQFVWDVDERLEARNAAGTITAQYCSGGEVISGTIYYSSHDHLGSVTELTNASGTILAELRYDIFGQPTQIQGTVASDFQYGGYYVHVPSGLHFTRTRAYSPRLGRFIKRDSIGEIGGLNLYAYVGNAPLYDTDPTGKDIYMTMGYAASSPIYWVHRDICVDSWRCNCSSKFGEQNRICFTYRANLKPRFPVFPHTFFTGELVLEAWEPGPNLMVRHTTCAQDKIALALLTKLQGTEGPYDLLFNCITVTQLLWDFLMSHL